MKRLFSCFFIISFLLAGCQHTREGMMIGEEFETFVIFLDKDGDELRRQSVKSGLWSETLIFNEEVYKVVLAMDSGHKTPFNWQVWLWKGIDHKRLLAEGYKAWQPVGVSINPEKLSDFDAIELIGWRGSRIEQAAWKISRYMRF